MVLYKEPPGCNKMSHKWGDPINKMALQTGHLCSPSVSAGVTSPGVGHINSLHLQRGKNTAEKDANMFALWWRIKTMPGVSQTSLPFPLVAWEQCTLHALNGIQVTFSLLLEQVLLEIKATVSEEQVWHLVHSTKNKSLTSSHTCQTCSKEISLGNITNTHFSLISKEELTYFFFAHLKHFLWEDQFAKTIGYVWNNHNHKRKLHAYEKGKWPDVCTGGNSR